jgi:choline dehydrogenase-like flavoprotein
MGLRDYHADEIYSNVRRMVTSVPKEQREIPAARTNPSEKSRQAAAQHPMMNAVGGTSIHYWTRSWRLKPWDFRTRSESIRRYGAGAIPQGSTAEDWPVTYDELEPYYDPSSGRWAFRERPGTYKARSTRVVMFHRRDYDTGGACAARRRRVHHQQHFNEQQADPLATGLSWVSTRLRIAPGLLRTSPGQWRTG